jgi:hypothetical protein
MIVKVGARGKSVAENYKQGHEETHVRMRIQVRKDAVRAEKSEKRGDVRAGAYD